MSAVVRLARPADAAAIVDVRIAAWRAAYAGLMPADYLAAMDDDRPAVVARLADRLDGSLSHTSLVGLDAAGVVVGACAFGPGRDEEPEAGELYAINVRPQAWGSGVGRALLREAEQALAGFPTAYLWVVEGNARARRFYERSGWPPDGGRKTDDRFGTGVTEVRCRRRHTCRNG